MTIQLTMAGEDWLSDGDKKRAARAISTRKKVGLDCARKLTIAAESLRAYLSACNECNDGSGSEQKGISDGRTILSRDLYEYAHFLEHKYDHG